MPRYSWEGRTATGGTVRGDLEAPSRESLLESLRSQGITVTKVEEKAGARTGASAVRTGASADPSPPKRPYRPGESWRDKLFYIGVAAVFALLGVGAAYVSPVLFYDCARQANGSVDCTVHRRMYGFIPLADLHFKRILSVEVKSGVHSETMTERSDRIRAGRAASSYEALALGCADGTRWQSPESSWPLGQTPSDHRLGIQGLLDSDSPGTYRGWTGEKVTLIVALAFWVPTGFILLGLILRLVLPRSFVEEALPALQAAAARHRSRRAQP
jgi:hypothetical protein